MTKDFDQDTASREPGERQQKRKLIDPHLVRAAAQHFEFGRVRRRRQARRGGGHLGLVLVLQLQLRTQLGGLARQRGPVREQWRG